ncbi:MAG TPA: alpha/beta hydrolase [Clostridiales bacterium]|nr:alpha/beta hydrolase [Clostridiales bacterium]
MFETIVFLGSFLLGLVFLLALLFNAVGFFVKYFRQKDRTLVVKRLRKTAILFSLSIILCVGFALFSQWHASTPQITDENGDIVAGSIAELRQVELNGHKEWISIRGYDQTKPVLLFLAGGPGGSQMAAVRYDLSELEKYFVVVNWDQPGAGKSYGAVAKGDLTPETYIEDGYALTKYLCAEFNQEKIYLIGESWGSALGIFMAASHPEYYHAFIGTGQMVDFVETERIDYAYAMEIASEAGDTDLVKKLEENGEPPYYGNDITMKSAVYLNYLNGLMTANPDIHHSGYNTMRDIAAAEYGILDKINYLRGILYTFNDVYQQLYDIDLREDYAKLQIPVYFLEGRHDINAPTSLVKAYYDLLDAPTKEIVWFEHSGHSPWINESDRFVKEILRIAEK